VLAQPRPVLRWVVPPPWLRPYVERIWSWTAPAGTTVPAVLPGVGAEAFVHVGAPFAVRELDGALRRLPPAHLLCLRGRSASFVAEQPVAFVSVRFRVGALRHFTQVPPDDLNDQFASLGDVLGRSAATLPERVHDRAGRLDDDAAFRRAVGVVVGALREALAERSVWVDRVLARLYYRAGDESVADAASATGTSMRAMQRAVRSATGLSPKQLQRLARFHHVARRVFVDGGDVLGAALDGGYYDQAHFIREARSLTGRTPGALFTEAPHFYNPRLSSRPEDRSGTSGSDRGSERRWVTERRRPARSW
jgi:AraC-like DNA-binding protein